MNTYVSKLATNAGYCNDRRVITLDGGIGNTITTYTSRDRLNTRTPSYKCSHESNDLFTTASAMYGNKKLTNPVALITADELAYAGSLYGNTNYQMYAHNGYHYWTLSPSIFSSGVAGSGFLNGGSIFGYYYVFISIGARPLVSLNSTALVTSGDGSMTSPYIVE